MITEDQRSKGSEKAFKVHTIRYTNSNPIPVTNSEWMNNKKKRNEISGTVMSLNV